MTSESTRDDGPVLRFDGAAETLVRGPRNITPIDSDDRTKESRVRMPIVDAVTMRSGLRQDPVGVLRAFKEGRLPK